MATAKKQYKDLTTAEKTAALALFKATYPVLQDETDTAYVTRIGQELLVKDALILNRNKKLKEANQLA